MVLNKILEDGSKDKIEIRLLGVDAPEFTQDNWGPKAREFVITELSGADSIEIEFDHEVKDKYGRSLIYLYYVVSDKQLESQKTKFLNEELLRTGFAEIYSDKDNNKYLRLFKDAEAHARFNKLNIWQEINGLSMSPKNYRKFIKKRKNTNVK
jgi:micrococcal nuclease